MVTKNKLLGSTATGSNSAASLVPPDEKIILRQAEQAFTDNATSATLAGSAVQRLAYAIMCEYATLVNADTKLASLANSGVGSEAFKLLSGIMVKFFLGKPENAKKLDDDQTANVKQLRSARIALLNTALKFAVTIAPHGVTFMSFNDKVGVFEVPSRLLVAKGDTAKGKLATARTIQLDNRPLAVETTAANGNPKLVAIRASVRQLMMANTIRAERAGGTDDGDANVESLVKSLHAILCADDDDKSEPVRKDAYPDAVWNMLGEIAEWYNDTVNSAMFNAKLVAKAA